MASGNYINASFISAPSKNYFIATQGPLATTILDFWEMVIQYNVSMIVMLCELTEGGREKCSFYWNEDLLKENGIDLTVDQKKVNDCLIVREFNYKKGSIKRKVTQLHFIGWPDHGAPSIDRVFGTFTKMIEYAIEEKKVNPSPVVVHCSAG